MLLVRSLIILSLANAYSQTSFASFQNSESMTIERLKAEAFSNCQSSFQRPVTIPVPVLDPPREGGIDAIGMTYQEELAVRSQNILDKNEFYISPRPRAAVNTLPMDVFVDNDDSGVYIKKTWEDSRFDYSSSTIQPPIDPAAIPDAGKVLTEVIIGHLSPAGDYPQLFDIRSSAYVRFAGFPPQVTGASLRLGAHRIFGLEGQEDFPIIRSIFLDAKDNHTAHAFVLLESDLFCGALSMSMSPTNENAEIIIDSYMYTREDFNWKNDPHTGLAAYSSMLWRTERNVPSISGEAHDSDTMRVKYADGTEKKITLEAPATGLLIQDLTETNGDPLEWILSNEDRDPAHYADFFPALQGTNYDKRASYNLKILESNIKTGVSLYIMGTDGEYGDNVVAVSTIREDIKKAKNKDEYVHFKYKTEAFYPQ